MKLNILAICVALALPLTAFADFGHRPNHNPVQPARPNHHHSVRPVRPHYAPSRPVYPQRRHHNRHGSIKLPPFLRIFF